MFYRTTNWVEKQIDKANDEGIVKGGLRAFGAGVVEGAVVGCTLVGIYEVSTIIIKSVVKAVKK